MIYFVTAIGTDSGKTVVSAIVTEAFSADYWKPIQAGLPKDSDHVKALISNGESKILPERYLLKTAASPHFAAEVDQVLIRLADFSLPDYKAETLVVEGAGGALVPINDTDFVIDIAQQIDCKLIVVCNLYLGSINHTLLTFSELRKRGLTIAGIVFNGKSNPASEEIILKHTQAKKLLHMLPADHIDQEWISGYAKDLRNNL
ncbi:MAG: dethiobiotin synthetase [Marivirga sp.]|jgi:dethiobiotin synthetase